MLGDEREVRHMSDEAFRSVLNEEAWVCRPSTRLAGDLTVATPTYDVLGQPQRVRVTPATAGVQATAMGRMPGETGVVYMEPRDVRVGDRLEVIKQKLRLAADAPAGDTTVAVEDPGGVAAGARVHLHHGTSAESVEVASIGGGVLTVAPSLRYGHASGEDVWVTQARDVEGACDEAGQGHHLKLLVRAVVGG